MLQVLCYLTFCCIRHLQCYYWLGLPPNPEWIGYCDRQCEHQDFWLLWITAVFWSYAHLLYFRRRLLHTSLRIFIKDQLCLDLEWDPQWNLTLPFMYLGLMCCLTCQCSISLSALLASWELNNLSMSYSQLEWIWIDGDEVKHLQMWVLGNNVNGKMAVYTYMLQYCTCEYHREQETGTEDVVDECVPGAHILGTWTWLSAWSFNKMLMCLCPS